MQPSPAASKAKAALLTALSGATAAFFVVVILTNLRSACDVPLNLWLIGAVLLSLPATYAADQLKKLGGLQATLWFEVFLLLVAFIWMSIGTVQINMSTSCETTAPLMWWSVFVTVTTFWCGAIGGTFFLLIIVLVPMFLSGGRTPSLM